MLLPAGPRRLTVKKMNNSAGVNLKTSTGTLTLVVFIQEETVYKNLLLGTLLLKVSSVLKRNIAKFSILQYVLKGSRLTRE